jgi:hypothetical protein
VRKPLLTTLAIVLVVALAIGARVLTTGDSPAAGPAAPDPAMDAFTARAAAAAGGPVRGPSVTVTGSELFVRYDRGACRVIMRLARREAPTAANAALEAGAGCPAAA